MAWTAQLLKGQRAPEVRGGYELLKHLKIRVKIKISKKCLGDE